MCVWTHMLGCRCLTRTWRGNWDTMQLPHAHVSGAGGGKGGEVGGCAAGGGAGGKASEGRKTSKAKPAAG